MSHMASIAVGFSHYVVEPEIFRSLDIGYKIRQVRTNGRFGHQVLQRASVSVTEHTAVTVLGYPVFHKFIVGKELFG